LTGPLIIPAWKPELLSPLKEIVDAITVKWFCDEAFTATELGDVVRHPFSRSEFRLRFNQIDLRFKASTYG
jgi:hypothetical protein